MRLTACIVDDEELDRYIARRRLTRCRRFAEMIEAEDGQVFLDRLFSTPPEAAAGCAPLVLMDINMPRLDGFETVETLKARMVELGWPEDVRVVFHSASNAPADRKRAQEMSIVKGHVVKPLKGQALEEILDDL